MKYLEEFDTFAESLKPLLESDQPEEKDPAKAMERLLKKGIMPDGAKWMDTPRMKWGFDNEPEIKKENKDDKGETLVYTVRLRLAPGKGGGGGVSVDSRATNQFYNVAGTDRQTLKASTKAFTVVAKQNARKLNSVLERWLRDPKNFLWRISGWEGRNDYTISDVIFKGVAYEEAVVDPSRRRWPAGRTEVWVPVVADVVMKLKKKAIKESVNDGRTLSYSKKNAVKPNEWKQIKVGDFFYSERDKLYFRVTTKDIKSVDGVKENVAVAVAVDPEDISKQVRNGEVYLTKEFISRKSLSHAFFEKKGMKEDVDVIVESDVKSVSHPVEKFGIEFIWPDPSGESQAALIGKDGKKIYGISYRCGSDCSSPEFWKDNFAEAADSIGKMSQEQYEAHINARVNGII